MRPEKSSNFQLQNFLLMFLTNENKEVHVQAQKAPLISPSGPLSSGASGPAAPHRCCDCHQTHHSSNSAQSSALSDVFSASASGFLAADSGPVRLRLLAPGWYNWIAGRSWRDGGKSFRQVHGRIVWKALLLFSPYFADALFSRPFSPLWQTSSPFLRGLPGFHTSSCPHCALSPFSPHLLASCMSSLRPAVLSFSAALHPDAWGAPSLSAAAPSPALCPDPCRAPWTPFVHVLQFCNWMTKAVSVKY